MSRVHPIFARILDWIGGPVPEVSEPQPYVPSHHDDAIDPLAPQMRQIEDSMRAYPDNHKGWDKLESELRK